LRTLDIMKRANSINFFNNVKDLFRINSLNEFQDLVASIGIRFSQYQSFIFEHSINRDYLELLNSHFVCTQK